MHKEKLNQITKYKKYLIPLYLLDALHLVKALHLAWKRSTSCRSSTSCRCGTTSCKSSKSCTSSTSCKSTISYRSSTSLSGTCVGSIPAGPNLKKNTLLFFFFLAVNYCPDSLYNVCFVDFCYLFA